MMIFKYLFMDVDGTLTDGKIHISNRGELYKTFDIKDGYALAVTAKNNNLEPVVITGRNSEIVDIRCKELNIQHVYQGVSNKIIKIKELISLFDIDVKQIAYIGDDLNDLEVIEYIKSNGGFTACPHNSAKEIKNIVHYVCASCGGDGAVREFIDFLTKK